MMRATSLAEKVGDVSEWDLSGMKDVARAARLLHPIGGEQLIGAVAAEAEAAARKNASGPPLMANARSRCPARTEVFSFLTTAPNAVAANQTISVRLPFATARRGSAGHQSIGHWRTSEQRRSGETWRS
jgi:hypothetical protein